MLLEIQSLGVSFQERFKGINYWPEIYFSEGEKELIKKLPNVINVYRSSILVSTDENKHSHLPSQYVLYATLIKEFAQSLYEHILVIRELKGLKIGNKKIHQLISNRDTNFPPFSRLSTEEIEYFFNLFGEDNSHALEAKSFLNSGETLRAEKDFFGSVILQVINVPNSSNSLLGDFIYYLCEKPEIYKELQSAYVKHLPFLIKETIAGSFAASVFRFLWNFDGLKNILPLITENKDSRYLSISEDKNKLTSVFQASTSRLSTNDLISSEKIRFTPTPQFIIEDKLIYISTEWTSGKESRLDIEIFKKIVETQYPEFNIKISDNDFQLTASSIGRKRGINLSKIKSITITKPFLLLAGISGTGKSRFVRKQAEPFSTDGSNFILIPVRPDWHEPSDLLGYVSRIPTERYVASQFLKFIVNAWIEAYESATSDGITLKPLENIAAYWACLDEMNLAPVEQYFADYLAVLETREWTNDGKYKCNSLVHPAQLLEKDDLTDLQKALGLEDHDGLWDHFKTHGIPIPPNLIVAGTVNMDETTHGFSRKVIDRAFTIDFGAFFPNEFGEIFEPQSQPKLLTFSRYSQANRDDLANVAADTDGKKSIAFLKEINDCLKATPFELAYRALNELLLAVKCFAPKDEVELSAVWDDFLLTKLLPRIEGDSEKLNFDGTDSLLTKLQSKVKEKLSLTGSRPDLLRTSITGGVINIEIRSIQKLEWMQDRLVKNNFTSFWP